MENKKEIKLPVAKKHDEIEESVAQLKEEAVSRYSWPHSGPTVGSKPRRRGVTYGVFYVKLGIFFSSVLRVGEDRQAHTYQTRRYYR